MSYDICIRDKDTAAVVRLKEKHYIRGGTFPAAGCDTATLNITYNYFGHFYTAFGTGGIAQFYGSVARDCIKPFKEAAQKLDPFDEGPDDDYWKPTGGNAAAALRDLVKLCVLAPYGIFDGD